LCLQQGVLATVVWIVLGAVFVAGPGFDLLYDILTGAISHSFLGRWTQVGEPHFMAPEVITKANQANRGAMAMVQNWCRFLQPLRTQLNSQAYRPKDTWKRNRAHKFSNAAMEDNASTSFEMMKII